MEATQKLLITLSLSIFILSITFVSSQEFSIDISGLTAEEYNPGEQITFKIILLEGTTETSQEVTYTLQDALHKKEITNTTTSNQEVSLTIGEDFPSGIWTITAESKDSSVIRTFNVGENQKVEFLIQADTLIIRNKGNTRYTKTLQITIGDEVNSYIQNIKAGEEKVLKLISADGTYNIKVTDGITTIKRENVQLFGVGNVVGAIDEGLVGYTGFAGAGNLRDSDNRIVSLKKLPLSLIFIAAIGILAFLVVAERRLTKKKNAN